jgi:hypothetical protein
MSRKPYHELRATLLWALLCALLLPCAITMAFNILGVHLSPWNIWCVLLFLGFAIGLFLLASRKSESKFVRTRRVLAILLFVLVYPICAWPTIHFVTKWIATEYDEYYFLRGVPLFLLDIGVILFTVSKVNQILKNRKNGMR